MQYQNLAENVGDRVEEVIEEFGRLVLITWAVIKDIFGGHVNPKRTLEQMVKIGYESLPLALITAGFVGAVFALQISSEFVRFGAGKYVGGVMGIGIARELGPAITGIVIAARVAAAITAEIGTMNVTEQIDALKALGSNPVRYIIVPRFVAAAVMLPLLSTLAIVVGFGGGYLVSAFVSKINPVEYMDNAQQLLKLWDIFGGLFKTIFFGMIIAIIACYRGLKTRGGAKGVGEATTSSVVTTLISLFIVNYFLSILFFK